MIFLPAARNSRIASAISVERGLAGAGAIGRAAARWPGIRESFAAARRDSVMSQSSVSVCRWPRASLKARLRADRRSSCSTICALTGWMTSAALAGRCGRLPRSAPMMKPKMMQQQYQVQDAAQPVEAAPDTPEEPAYCAQGTQTFSSMRAALPEQVTQVVELGATHVAATLHRDVVDARAVQLEHAFHALAVRDLAHGDRGVEAAVAARDHDAFVGLHALAVAFLHLHVHDDGVAGLEFRHLARGAFGFDLLDDVVHLSTAFPAKTRSTIRLPLPCSPGVAPGTGPAVAAMSCPAPRGAASAVCARGHRPAAPRGTLSPANSSGRV